MSADSGIIVAGYTGCDADGKERDMDKILGLEYGADDYSETV